jgi:hypothetical protein
MFSDEGGRLELVTEAEPWVLARALEASAVGQAALDALEEAVGNFARSYPSTAPPVLTRPVLEHFRLREEGKALAYFTVAVQAADDAGSPDLAAWALATRSLIPTYNGHPAAALGWLPGHQPPSSRGLDPERSPAWGSCRCAWPSGPTRSTASGPRSNPGRPSWSRSAQRGRLAQQH